ncbi:SMP-30/gluconolactonase/LRE family protein [Roseateles sp.]|uniref:SMP-30/gluconolactonase/LRE family protein n=1 Tax=Roseateles sp. TaxID=1971397 RepID=UPI003264D244
MSDAAGLLPSAIPGVISARPVHCDIVDPRFRAFVLPNAWLETLANDCRWLEGPVWFADHEMLLVSDVPNDRLLRWTAAGGTQVQRQPAGFPNGHTRDREGRLITCSHGHRHVARTEPDGRLTVLADRFDGQPLNGPNDVVVKRDGSIWFTDPHYGIASDYEGHKAAPQLPPSVYRIDPVSGALTRVADDFDGPNGLCFSPDEKQLYVAESGTQFAATPQRHIRVFDVDEGGGRLGHGRVFHVVAPGYADGFRCDSDGNLWTGAGDGVHCLHPSGALLGRIHLPTAVANLCFGGPQRSRLFLCAGRELHALTVNVRGCQWP